MKRSMLLVSLLVIAATLLTACQPTVTKVQVATDATFPPFEIVDEKTKELTGFDVELMRAIAKKAGFEIDFVNIGFDPLLAGLSKCQYDMAIAAITITDDRKKEMLFSDAYINAGQIVSIKKGNTTIKSKDDLVGKTLGAQIGTTGAIEAGKIANAKVKTYDAYELAFLDLANGQVDAVIADYPTALGFIAKTDKLTTVGAVFTDENYGVALCKTKTDLQKKVNEALATLKKDGTITALEKKWLAGQ
jgi:polar amino acid transport system substrate-binding protein